MTQPEPRELCIESLVRGHTIVITGEPGHGKTEVAANLAVAAVEGRGSAALVDLDVATPLFRSRDARTALAEMGVCVVEPGERLRGSDLPLLPSELGRVIHSGATVIIDCGGGATGARTLASLGVISSSVDVLAVVNPYRPGDPGSALTELEAVGRFRLDGLISNPHLGVETTPDLIRVGHERVADLAVRLGVELRFACAVGDTVDLDVPVLRLRLFMVPPWHPAKWR